MKNCTFGLSEHKPFLKDTNNSNKHTHEHNHSHDHRTTDKKVLKIALFITFFTMIVEFVTGFLSNSLALISDAIHMFTHSFALIVSLAAIIIASKKAPMQKSFGYYRIEVLAAFINGVTIVLSIFWILYEAIERFIHPEEIELKSAFIVALVGFIVNIITGIILMQGDKENVNLKSSFIHMLSDALSSVAILIGYIVIYFTQWYIIDIILALFVSIIIAIWAKNVLTKSVNTLLESSPHNIKEVQSFIEQNEKVIELHDIHLWEITQGMNIMTAHLKIEKNNIDDYKEILKNINEDLKEKFQIVHTTFQLEW